MKTIKNIITLVLLLFSINAFSNTDTLVVCNTPKNLKVIKKDSVIIFKWEMENLILHEDFEEDPFNYGWTKVDADGDGYNWDWEGPFYETIWGHNGTRCVSSASYYPYAWVQYGNNYLFPDDYLITPKLNNAKYINYWVSATEPCYSLEHYALLASKTGNNIDDFTINIFEETMTFLPDSIDSSTNLWYERTFELPEGTNYVAFRHYNCTDQWFLSIDDVFIFNDNIDKDNYLCDFSFNIYKDGEFVLNTNRLFYVDSIVDNQIHYYCVEAVCDSTIVTEQICISNEDVVINPIENLNVELLDNNVGKISWDLPLEIDPNNFDFDLTGYIIYANDSIIANINDINNLVYYDSTFMVLDNEEIVNYCVAAIYYSQIINSEYVSEKVCEQITFPISDINVNPIENLNVELLDNNVGKISWDLPLEIDPNNFDFNLTGYIIYANDSIIANINDINNLVYYDSTFMNQEYNRIINYCITAIYYSEINYELLGSEQKCKRLKYPLNIDNYSNNNTIIYPNPTNNIINIITTNNKIKKVAIFNNIGKNIFDINNVDKNNLNIDLSKFNNGLYFIKVYFDDGNQRYFKVIKN